MVERIEDLDDTAAEDDGDIIAQNDLVGGQDWKSRVVRVDVPNIGG